MAEGNKLMWQIAGGIIIAAVALSVLAAFIEHVEEDRAEIALREWEREHPTAPATFRESIAVLQTVTVHVTKPAPPEHTRCVNGRLFQQIPGGWKSKSRTLSEMFCDPP